MAAPTVVILAGGLGTRMRSSLPKVLHPVAGRPMVLWPVLAAQAAGAGRIVETKNPGDATPEQLEIREVNTGVYVFDASALRTALDAITPDNAQGEYYLPDVIPALAAQGLATAAHATRDHTLTLGVNDRA